MMRQDNVFSILWGVVFWCAVRTLRLSILIILTAITIIACSDNELASNTSTQNPATEKEVPEKVELKKGAKLPLVDPSQLANYKEWQLEFLPEAPLDDKEFWSHPRIQFVWGIERFKDDEEEPYAILSMRLDGTDIRMALPGDKLWGDNKATLMHPPARSPNNRYIAAGMTGPDKKESSYKVLFDLQEDTSEIIAYGGGIPNFIWTPDSENLIFYLDDKMKNYHVPTKTLTDRPFVYSSGGTLYLRNNRFIASRNNRIEISDFDGNKIKTIPLPDRVIGPHNLSADGRFFFFSAQQVQIFDIEKETTVYAYPNVRTAPRFMEFDPYTNEVIYHDRAGLTKHNFESDTKKVIFPVKKYGIPESSIINFPPIYPKP